MPTFTIETPSGRKVRIEAPDQQTAIRGAEEWEASQAKTAAQTAQPDAPDPYRAQAAKDIETAKAAGYGTDGYGRRYLQGATFGAADEILAGLQAPFEMMRQGTFNPAEGYRYAKAREDMMLEEARQNQGVAGTIAELGGGVVSGTALGRAGATFMPMGPGAGLTARIGGAAADGAVYGAVSGFNEGSGVGDRLSNAALGGAVGGVAGAAIPAIGAALSGPVSALRAAINPQGVAESQFARAIAESGRSADDIARGVAQAAQEGQGVYTVADEMGNAGQRMLSSVARSPGEGRQAATEFLDARQAGQARRVANALDEGFQARQTAAQLQAAQEAARRTEGNALYGSARNQAVAVDLSRPIALADDFLQPGVSRVMNPGSGIADDSVESAVRRARSYLTDGQSVLSDFDSVLRAKQEIDSIIDRASPTQQRVLIPIRNEIDRALEAASPGYAQARNAYREASQGIEAIQTGRQAAQRGRYEDTIPAYQGMSPRQQEGFRTGYADNYIEGVQAAPEGVNKARQFTTEAARQELPAFAAPGQGDLMMRRLARENTMFATRNQATGGSRTADNLADMEAMRVDPTVFGNLLTGNITGALSAGTRGFLNTLSGYTPAVREELGRLLLMRGTDPQVVQALTRAMDNSTRARQTVVRYITGLMGGAAVAPNALPQGGQTGR